MEEYKITLAAARVNAGMTQDDIAQKLHVTKQTIVNWEKGKVIPKPAQFYMLCKEYNAPENLIILPDNIT